MQLSQFPFFLCPKSNIFWTLDKMGTRELGNLV